MLLLLHNKLMTCTFTFEFLSFFLSFSFEIDAYYDLDLNKKVVQ